MSIDAIKWAQTLKPERRFQDGLPSTTPEALRTLVTLALNECDNFTWISAGKVAKLRGLARGTVYKHLHALELSGHIRRVSVDALKGSVAHGRYTSRTKYKPTIYRLATPESVTAVETVSAGEVVTATETRPVTPGETPPVTATETTREEVVDQSLEEGSEVISEAQADLGGIGSPRPKTFPKQCATHQTALHDTPCLGCKTARESYEKRLELAAADRVEAVRRGRLVEQHAKARALKACTACNDAGYLPGGKVCRYDDALQLHFWDPKHPDRIAEQAAKAVTS